MKNISPEVYERNILLTREKSPAGIVADRLSRSLKVMEEIESVIKNKGAKIFFLCHLDDEFVKAEYKLKNSILTALNQYNLPGSSFSL